MPYGKEFWQFESFISLQFLSYNKQLRSQLLWDWKRSHLTISCLLYLSVVRTQQKKMTVFWQWILLSFLQCPAFSRHYIMCDHKQWLCLQNMPGLIYPKKTAIHQNSHPSALPLTTAAVTQSITGTPLAEFSSNLVNEPHKKIMPINLQSHIILTIKDVILLDGSYTSHLSVLTLNNFWPFLHVKPTIHGGISASDEHIQKNNSFKIPFKGCLVICLAHGWHPITICEMVGRVPQIEKTENICKGTGL